MPEVLWALPDVSADLGPCSSACGVDQLSPATRAPVLWPTRSTGTPGPLAGGSEGPRCRQALLGHSCSGPRARGFDQLSRAIGLGPDGLHGRPAVPEDSRPAPIARGLDHMSRGIWGRVPVPAVSNSSPGRLGLGSDGPRGRPAVPGDSGQCLMARDVEQLTQATRTQVRGPAGLTSSPRQLGNRSVVPRGRPAHLGDTGPVRGPALSTRCL